MKFDQVMLDLETLGVREGAAIVSIGAARFSLEDDDIIETFEAKIALDSERFGEIDPSTVQWWFGQNPEAIKETFKPEGRVSLWQALTDFDDFLSRSETNALWSNGPSFDDVLIRGAWARCMDGDFPLSFRTARDYRTIRQVGIAMGIDPVRFEGVKHSAFADAINQARNVIEVFKALPKP